MYLLCLKVSPLVTPRSSMTSSLRFSTSIANNSHARAMKKAMQMRAPCQSLFKIHVRAL